MKREIEKWSVEQICKLIKLNPATLVSTIIEGNKKSPSCSL